MEITQDVLRELKLPRCNPESIQRAFFHRSSVSKDYRSTESSWFGDNERLEFLGDAVVHCVMTSYVYRRYCNNGEGSLTKKRNRLVCGQMMSEISEKLGLSKYLKITEEKRNDPDVLEDVFEALIGALYLEAGYEETEKWIIATYEENVNMSDILTNDIEHKDTIIKYFSSTGRGIPIFELVKKTSLNYRVSLKTTQGLVIGVGEGRTRRQAENSAAMNALKYLNV